MTRLEADNWIVLISARNKFLFDIASLIIIYEDINLSSVKAPDGMKIVVIGRWMEDRRKIKEIEFYAMKVILGKNLKSVSVIEDLCEFDRQSRYNFRDFSS